MPTTITRYKCNKCGGEYATSTEASNCETNRHPADTMSFALSTQKYLPYDTVPDNIKYTLNGKIYTYYIKK